jgi:UDP-N-acetylglucosamine 2-epimerase (non-hydrolysing)
MKIANIVGARPNFMKIAPIHQRMQKVSGIEPFLIHTGQHYDEKMSASFFVDLGLPEPDIYLGVGSGSHSEQTGTVMIELEKVLMREKPDWIVVVGDVNSTLAASLVASKLHIPVAHVEAGLRSGDRTMPEEINRILTDAVSELLFVTESSGEKNLLREGIAADKIRFVGNVMIDSLIDHLQKASLSGIMATLSLQPQQYALMTLHRPSNVDDKTVFSRILDALDKIQQQIPIIFPIHPRTRKMIDQLGFSQRVRELCQLMLLEPLGYLEFLQLMRNACLVLTDSGGIQEETTWLGIPCLTLRENTERPITVEIGTNQLVGMDTQRIILAAEKALNGSLTEHQVPPLWDGKTSQRIVDVFAQLL